MIARAFHRWERRLAAVATDRIPRPFEWGLDWLADQPLPAGDPRQVLQAWGEAAVQRSDAFYEVEPASDYRLTGDILTFTSAVETPHRDNNLVRARYFAMARRAGANARCWCCRNGIPTRTDTSVSAVC